MGALRIVGIEFLLGTVRSLRRLFLPAVFLGQRDRCQWEYLLVHLVPPDHSPTSADPRIVMREVQQEVCWVRWPQDASDWRQG